VVIPHQTYFERVYKIVHDHRALIIADETQTGLGRTGDHFWGFQNYGSGLVPDIITVGRPLGAGHPIAAVITSAGVSRKLGSYFSTFGGNPVSCAIGLAVLDVINNENLMSSARNVGKLLSDLLHDLQAKYPEWIGNIRGKGLVTGLEIVTDADSKSPNSVLALDVMYSLKAEKVLVGITGKHRNVLFISPPMCFNIENCRRYFTSIRSILTKILISH
jgi:ethanolamine-phosphate phospho-lyase